MEKVAKLDEKIIHDIGHAFGYYDYGEEHGLVDAFPNRDAVSSFICGYVRMALKSGMLYDLIKYPDPALQESENLQNSEK